MTARQRSRQAELFPRSQLSVIAIEENHRSLQMTDDVDWTELMELVESTPGGRRIYGR